MSKIIVNTEVMGPDFSELVLHELNYEWSREVVTLAASEADLPFGMVLMREAGEYKPLTESTVESAQKLGGAPVAVLIGAVKASESAQPGIVIRRGAILNGAALKFDASITTLQAYAKLALSDLGIVIKAQPMPIQNYPTVFDCTEMTAAVNKLPARPFFFKPLFEVKGVKTTTVSLDIRKGRIVLIGDSERNTAPESLAGRGAKREWKHLSCAHLAQMDTLAPEDLQDVRAFGSTEPISVAAVYNDKMQQLKDNLAATMEFHRLGAIKGVVLDADGTTVLHDIFNTFGATKKTLDISFPKTAADDANPILTSILKAKRHVEAAMGGTPFDHIECIIGSDAYDMLTSHKLVREYFERWLSNRENFGNNDYRKRGFPYGGLTFVERSDVVGGQTMVAAKKGHVYPVGPGIFKQYHAPADWMETVNTIGLEYYARMDEKPKGRGFDLEVQSNPLTLCTYPEALVELTFKAA